MQDQQFYPSARPAIPFWKRTLGWSILVLLLAVMASMVVGGIFLLRHTFSQNIAPDDRLFDGLYAAALLTLPASLIWILIKTRITTGRWTGHQQQRSLACYPQFNSSPANWITFSTNWATFTAGDRSASMQKRAIAWTTIVLFAAGLLAVTAFAVICFGAAFADDNTALERFLFLALGAAILLFPGLTVWSFIKKKRLTGSWRTSREQMQTMTAARERWRMREYARPMRSKMSVLAINAVVLLVLWLRTTVFHAHHPHSSWITPAFWTVVAVYAVGIQFRKPRPSAVEPAQQ
jgi:hypothetical protein